MQAGYGGRVSTATYLIAIGSNQRTKWGTPYSLVASLLSASAPPRETLPGITRRRGDAERVITASRVHNTTAIGSGMRYYANAVAFIESELSPDILLHKLKKIELAAGRRPGRQWGDRPLDLDIIAWSGGIWASPGLAIPHPEFRKRRFVLAPLCEIAPGWRDPVTGLTARHLLARLDRKRPRA